MPAWKRLRQLSRADWALLLRAGSVVCLVRLGLCILPFRSLRRVIARLRNGTIPPATRPTPARIAWAVAAASRLVPRATCLTQALATQVLLTRVGYRGVLHLGVALDDAGKLLAHAWLECQGAIIIGGEGKRQFTPLPPLEMGPE